MSEASFVTELRRLSDADTLLILDQDVMAAYSRDRAPWVPFGTPAVVVCPAEEDGVRLTLEIAARHEVPVVPRGAGSGLAGGANAVDGCIVLSTHRLRAQPAVDPVNRIVRVRAGMLNAEVKAAAAEHGLYYPPDPASSSYCTIGGNLATNAGGLCCVRYGVTRDWVRQVRAILPGGDVLEAGHMPVKGVVGYDLAGLLVGSEGTLGVITEATLRLVTATPPVTTVVASFAQLSEVGQAVEAILAGPQPPAMLEVMDQTTIRAVEAMQRMDLDTQAAALLIAQVDQTLSAGGEDVRKACLAAGATDVFSSSDPAESEMLMQARRRAFDAVERLGAPLLEDISVPVSAIATIIDQVEQIGAAHGITVATFGHAGDGNLHPVVILPDTTAGTQRRAQLTFEAILRAALSVGGSITGEHGVGVLKLPYVPEELAPAAIKLMAGIKAWVDPLNIMNPGKALVAQIDQSSQVLAGDHRALAVAQRTRSG